MASSRRVPVLLSQVTASSKSSPYICRSCRQQLQNGSKPNAQQVRHATTPFTEKLRRKIWGTDNPPGLADPYGPSFMERRKMALEEQAERERRARLTVDDRIQEDAMRERQEMAHYRPNVVDRDFDQPFEDDPEMEEAVPEEVYKPAETWDGLQHIGHRGFWKDMAPQPGDYYEPWLNERPELPWTRQQLVQFLHHAVTQNLASLTLRNVTPRFLKSEDFSTYSINLGPDGRLASVEKRPEALKTPQKPIPTFFDDMSDDLAPELAAEDTLPAYEASQFEDQITDAETAKIVEEITASSPKLQDAPEDESPVAEEVSEFRAQITDAQAEKIVEEISAESPNLQADPEEAISSTPAVDEAPVDEAFLAARLDFADPLTFKILKCFQQLTSLRLPDPVLNTLFKANNDSSAEPPLTKLINHILEDQKPKPKNLYEKLMEKQQLAGQGNLMILPRRYTPVDKEKEVGRWKVIERELRERGLPVLGRIQAQQ